MTDEPIERVFLPSHVRRGRLSVDPVWHVTTPGGSKWQFRTRREARAFVASDYTEPRFGVCIETPARLHVKGLEIEAEGISSEVIGAVRDALGDPDRTLFGNPKGKP